MTIKNGTVKHNGSSHGAVYMYGSAVVTIASDAVINGDNGMAIHGQSGKLTVNGTVRADGGYAIAGNGDVSGGIVDSIDIIVNDGAVISAPNGIGIYHPQKGTVTVNGGTITGHTGIEMCSGKLVVNGGTITSTGDNYNATGSQNAILDGAAISLINRNYSGGIPSAEINDGTITASGTNALAIKAYDYKQDNVAEWVDVADYVKVSAGTFSSDVSAFVVADSVFTDNGDGTYSVKGKAYAAEAGGVKYETVAEAIKAVAADSTVTLISDVTEDVVINKNITLDLGGKTLTNTNAGKATISVQNGATVTVTNGNVVGGTSYYNIEVVKGSNANLTLTGVTATAGNTGSSMIDNWGTLTIESGTYTGGLNVVKSEEGSTLVINGGDFTLDYATKDYTAVILVYGDTTISGGTFTQSLTTTGRWNHPQVVATGVVEGYTAITRVTGGKFTNKMSGEGIFRGVGKGTSDNFRVSGGTFNKSISDAYCADGFIPTKNADGTYGVKAGKYVASIGSKNYETLADAIRLAANSKTITLLCDVDENVTVTANKNITIDLNGYTLNGGTGTSTPTILNHGTLTITDSSADKTGTIKRADNGIEGVTSYYVIMNNGTMTIENAIVTNNSGYKKTNSSGSMVGSSLIINIGEADKYAVLNIKGGTFTQNNFIAIKNDSCSELNVSGGIIKSNHSAVQNWCTAYITGGELNGQLWTDAWKETSTGKTVVRGDAKLNGEIVMDITGSIVPTLEISGGSHNVTWKVTTAAAIAGAKPQVSGGTFTAAVPGDYCADGFIPTKNADGTYTVKSGSYVAETGGIKYESLEEAINAAKSGATVKMLADTYANVTVTKKLTLDLNGFTINGGQVEDKAAVKIDNARVTIMDSSAGQTGTIMREDTAGNSGVSSYYVIDIQGKYGFLRFEGGNVINNSGTKSGKGASLVRLGNDNVRDANPTLTITGGTFTQDNFVAIKVDYGTLHLLGGVVNSANSYAVENWRAANIKGGTVNGTVSSWAYSTGVAYSTLTISGGTVNGNVASVNYDSAADKQARIYVKGGTVTGTLGTYTYANGLVPTDETAMATIEVTAGTFAKDPTKYVVEKSAVKPNENGTFSVEETVLAKIGDAEYYTMDAAYKAQKENGGVIVLQRDYTTAETFNSGESNRELDLGGYTWTYTGADVNSAAFEINYPNASITVKNGTIISSQFVGLIPAASSYTGTITYDNAALVFENVEMTANGHGGIETNGSNTDDSVTLIDSTLNVPNGYGIYFPSSGTLTINNSVINAKTMGVQVCAGSLNIVGDKSAITVTGGPVEKTENDGAIEDGAAISVIYRPGYKDLGKVKVEAGRFTAKTGNYALKAYEWKGMTESTFDNTNGTIAVSGGTFTTAVSEDYCADGFIPTQNEDGSYGVKEGEYVAQVLDADGNFVQAYETLAEAFDNVETGYTVRLLKNITLTEQINIVKALNGLTLDGNGYTITCATTTDPMQSGGSALYFGNANDKLYCTGIKIKDLTMEGTARFAIFLCGGTSTEFTNVKISGNYYIAVNLYGTHGAVMTNCDISNSNTITTDKYVSAIWSNVSSANPLVLNNTKVSSIAINTYTTANKLEPKIFVNDGSVTEVHTFDDGTVSGNRKLCVSPDSTGEYTIRIYDAENTKWIPIPQYTVTTTVSPAGAGVLTGGGAYEEGTEVTITATANGGYEFLGWYKGGERVSQNATYTFKVSANADFVAMFRGTEKVKLSVNVGAGKVNYKYGDVEGRWSGPAIDQLYSKGTSFTITAVPNAGYKFLYWINAENKVVSEAPEYSFILGDKTGLTACYVEDTGSTEYAYVVFRDTITKDIHWSGDVKLTGGVGAVAVPSMPYYSGYTFAGWFDADGNEFEVNANGNISVTANAIIFAKYVADSELYTVTVDGAALETKYAYGSSVTVTADEKDADGKYFAGWYVGNTCVSMNATYSFIIKSDVVLTTMYSTEKPEPEAVVTITVSERTAVSGTNKVAVATNVAWSLPEGCKLAKAGILYTFNDAYADKLTAENIGDSNIYVSNPSTTAAEGNYGFTISMGPKSAAKNLYVRGYITYVDAAGNIETLYTGASVKSPAGN